MVDDVLFDMLYSIRNIPCDQHLHDCIEIAITYSGHATHVAGNTQEELQQGDVFIILPGCSHGLPQCDNFEHVTISCSPQILERIGINLSFIHGVRELFTSLRGVTSFHLNRLEFNDARNLINTMLTAYEKNKAEEKGNLRSYFAMLLCLFAQSYSLHHKSNSVTARIDKAILYMNTHFKQPILLPEIAAIANLSVSQFGRIFKKYFDTSPIDYILDLRLNESRRLLKYTELNIAEISYIVGISDTNYFSRIFKKKFGISPRQARNGRL